jgi:hypothetical protein
VVFPARVFHVKSCVSCGLIPLLVVVYSPSFITNLTNSNSISYPTHATARLFLRWPNVRPYMTSDYNFGMVYDISRIKRKYTEAYS